MANSFFETPILFIVFNRLDKAYIVFETIKKLRPRFLYIAADGPRPERSGEKKLCENIRKKLLNEIDWPCEVKTLFQESNLGCKLGVSKAITWFFENVEEGIILEDDCLPDESFFKFCSELLIKYRNNDEVAVISGNHFGSETFGDASYYFKRIPHIWGWATWRRVWQKYDISMRSYPEFRKNKRIKEIWSSKKVQNYWLNIFDQVYKNKIDTWDYQLAFSIFFNNEICICPNYNLVSNIGFGKDFTNTVLADKRITGLSLNKISFPLINPKEIKISEEADDYVNKIYLRFWLTKKVLKSLRIFTLIKKVYIIIKH
jgi:hypothetical protein